MMKGNWFSFVIWLVFISRAASEEGNRARGAGEEAPGEAMVAATATSWPLFRGDARASGIAVSSLPKSLAVVWKFEVPESAFGGAAAIRDGSVYVGDLDGGLYSLSLEDGTEQWRHKVEIGFPAAPAVDRGRVYIGDYDGIFHCVDAVTGRPLWTFTTNAQIDSSANFFGPNVVFGSQDATLYCLNAASGELVWKHEINDQIRCSPSIAEVQALVAGCDAKLHVIGLDQGDGVRAIEIDGPTGVTPAVEGDQAFFGTESGTVYAVNWRTGEVVWQVEGEKPLPIRASPAVGQGILVVAGHNKTVTGFDAKSGAILWKFVTRRRLESSPVLVGSRVLVGGTDGRLYDLALATGEKLADYELGGSLTASPAVAAERLVIANDRGVVYCLGAPRITSPSTEHDDDD